MESVEIKEGIKCEFNNNILKCKKEDIEAVRKLFVKGTEIKVENNKLIFICERANRKDIASIKSTIAHIENMFKGLNEKFMYKLEICHVHFPMSIKVQSDKVLVSNFLGEKKSRTAEILPEVEVEVKGNEIIVSSSNIENAGQTAANIERATKVRMKDRRIFQDGIFIKEKPGGKL